MTDQRDGSLHWDEICAATETTEFVAWLRNAATDDRNISEIVRRLRAFWIAAYTLGIETKQKRAAMTGQRRTEAELDAERDEELERLAIDHGV